MPGNQAVSVYLPTGDFRQVYLFPEERRRGGVWPPGDCRLGERVILMKGIFSHNGATAPAFILF